MVNFQDSVARFVEAHQLEIAVSARVLDLVSEVGEIAKEILKSTGIKITARL